jgi:hypothetical protein
MPTVITRSVMTTLPSRKRYKSRTNVNDLFHQATPTLPRKGGGSDRAAPRER